MSTPSRKRLMRDFKRMQTDPPSGVLGTPESNNIMHWNAVIFGYAVNFISYVDHVITLLFHLTVTRPDDTDWEGGQTTNLRTLLIYC